MTNLFVPSSSHKTRLLEQTAYIFLLYPWVLHRCRRENKPEYCYQPRVLSNRLAEFGRGVSISLVTFLGLPAILRRWGQTDWSKNPVLGICWDESSSLFGGCDNDFNVHFACITNKRCDCQLEGRKEVLALVSSLRVSYFCNIPALIFITGPLWQWLWEPLWSRKLPLSGPWGTVACGVWPATERELEAGGDLAMICG